MRKIATIGLLTLLMGFGLGGPSNAHAATSAIQVVINGQTQSYDQPPVIVNGRTLVPLRGIFEALGASIDWNNDTRTVTAVKGNTTVSLKIGSKTAVKNGQNVTLDVEAQLINGRTMVPVRFVGEAMGADVQWVTATNSVEIKSVDTSKVLSAEEIGAFSDRIVLVEVMDEKGEVIGAGSGFVVSSDGEIITNEHVTYGASSAKITFADKKSYTTTTLLNSDEKNDLALLKIDATNLPVVTFGDSSKVKLGQSVVAIGSPLGLQNTLSTGVISTTSRMIDETEFIQTSAPIDHGSSGGALFNMSGEVIGVTAAGMDSTASLNLAIPSNTVKQFLEQPKKQTKMEPPAREHLSNEQLSKFLNTEREGVLLDGYAYHFDYVMAIDQSGDNPPFVMMKLESEADVKRLLAYDKKEEYTVLPSLLLEIADDLYMKGMDMPVIVVTSKEESSDYPGMIVFSLFDYKNGIYRFQFDPENDGPLSDVPLSLPRK